MKSNIPLLKDFSSHKVMCLDEKQAIEHFLGKTFDDAKKLFKKNDLYYADDLRWMEEKAFQFYLPAFIEFIMSDDRNVSSDTLTSFLSLLRSKLEYELDAIKSCRSILIKSLEYCIHNYSKFDVDIEIYGDLKNEIFKILNIIREIHG